MPAGIPVFDGHNDTLQRLLPRTGDAPQSILDHGDSGHLDVPRARAGGMAGGFFAIYIRAQESRNPPEPVPDDNNAWTWTPPAIDVAWARTECDRLLTGIDALFDAHPEQLMRCLTHDDLVACLSDDRLGILLHIEGPAMIGPDCAELPELYERGIRSIGPVWSRPNCFAHGIRFGWPSSNDIGPGLTEAGRRLVAECEALGIAIDLSHMNRQGFLDTAQCATKPLIATHCGAHALCESARNLTDDQLRMVADSGGVVGVNFYTGDLRGDGLNDADMPLDRLVDHVLYMLDVMGEDHVALGSDFDGAVMCDELGDASGFPCLLELITGRGVSDTALSKIAHGNFLRVLEHHLT